MRAISFGPPMIRAILAGCKTQTRRLVSDADKPIVDGGNGRFRLDAPTCRYGQPGDRLWVKEELRIADRRTRIGVMSYTADGERVICEGSGVAWPYKRPVLPARFCPRYASRLTIEIEDLQQQSLLEITEADATAEGFESKNDFLLYFLSTLHSTPANSETTPSVWRIVFRVVSNERTLYFAG
ncbi:MAG: hypothetical protein HQL56_08215 [Magnetococcales bacterium]|nr:hypothetical protein [Magnetococcales bacterium]